MDVVDVHRAVRDGQQCFECKDGKVIKSTMTLRPHGPVFQCHGCFFLFVNNWDGTSTSFVPPKKELIPES